MLSSLLTTKLLVPPQHVTLVPRPRLVARLAEGLSRPLTLISAPPGSGKTTLLGEWLATRDTRHPAPAKSPKGDTRLAWLALDEDDNDRTRFLTYLIAALEKIYPDVGRPALDYLDAPSPSPSKTILTALINRLALVSADFVLTLDDYHVITNPAVHDAVTYLLDHMPPRMHLVILTRSDPPLPLGRLRVRGQLVEIRAADLRFTDAEAAEFLRLAGLSLSDEGVAALLTRTEGWAAGLHLAALSMQRHENADEFVRTLTVNDAYLLDYLSEEVLQRLPADTQDFLLKTSVLTHLTAPLCDALLDRTDSQLVLDHLTRANLFLVPLDHDRRWYRYHHLFGDLLRYRLDVSYRGLAPDLHRRAAAWYQQADMPYEAIRHALAAFDYSLAAHLIEQDADAMLKRGEAVFLKWIGALPADILRTRPRLCLVYAWSLLPGRQYPAIERLLTDALAARASLDSKGRDAVEGEAAVIRAFMALDLGDALRAIENARHALTLLPADQPNLASSASLSLGLAFTLQGETDAAATAYAEAHRLAQAAGNVEVTLRAMREMARLKARHGQPREGGEMMKQAIRLAALTTASGTVYAKMADMTYAMNELDTSADYWLKTIEHCRQTDNPELLAEAFQALSRVRHAQARPTEAVNLAHQADQVRQTHRLPHLVPYAVAEHPRLGDVDAAVRWSLAPECQVTPDDTLTDALEFQHLLLGRALIARGLSHVALRLLPRLAAATVQTGHMAFAVAAHIFLALAWQAEGDKGPALAALGLALDLGEQIGYIRLFADQGQPMAHLLASVKTEDTRLRNYIAKLQAAFPLPTPSLSHPSSVTSHQFPVISPHSALVEPLSEREKEILHLLAEGASNRLIADRLVLALGTVKTHIHNIYGKLGVESRTQAIARAQALGIINPH